MLGSISFEPLFMENPDTVIVAGSVGKLLSLVQVEPVTANRKLTLR